MQPRDVARVDAALERLEPVRLLPALRRVRLLRRRRGRTRTPAAAAACSGSPRYVQRMSPTLTSGYDVSLHLAGEVAVLRLGRHLEAAAVRVVLPAVVGAADAALLDVAEPERGAAVRAELVDQAVLALGVAERDQALGEDLHAHGRAVVLGQLLREERRDPVLPEEVARRRPRPGPRQKLVDLLLEHRLDPDLSSMVIPLLPAASRASRRGYTRRAFSSKILRLSSSGRRARRRSASCRPSGARSPGRCRARRRASPTRTGRCRRRSRAPSRSIPAWW